MPLNKIGFNISGLSNVTLPEFNVSDTPRELIEQMPEKVNEVTNNHYGLIILSTLFFYVYWRVTNITFQDNLNYSKIRGLCITSTICGIIGGVMTTMGYFTEIYYTIFFMVVSLLSFLFIKVQEK